MQTIAFDIETCPHPAETMTPAQRRRRARDLTTRLRRTPEMDEEDASRLVCSLSPFLGWICVISVCRAAAGQPPRPPKSYIAACVEEERMMLARFWNDVARLPRHVRWVSFNAKRFDSPMLAARTLHQGLTPTRRDILCQHPYRQRNHLDLCGLWPSCAYGLDDLCGLLGIATPKDQIDGSQVAATVAAGRIDEVARYCERDAQATLECALALPAVLIPD